VNDIYTTEERGTTVDVLMKYRESSSVLMTTAQRSMVVRVVSTYTSRLSIMGATKLTEKRLRSHLSMLKYLAFKSLQRLSSKLLIYLQALLSKLLNKLEYKSRRMS
jgi:hypothetical protein